MATACQKKFSGFLCTCDEARKREFQIVLMRPPEVFGDNYEEIVESPNRLAYATLSLFIAPRFARGQ